MALDTFDALVSAVVGFTENSDTEFANMLPYLVNLAENRITRDLDTYGFVCHFTVSAAAADPYLTKPTGTLYIKNLEYTAPDGTRSYLDKKTDEFLKIYWPERTSVGVPEMYAEWDQSTVIVAPAASVGGIFEIAIVAAPTALTSAHVSNWHTNYAMNALFYATMMEAYAFMKEWETLEIWERRYQQEISKLKQETNSTRFDEMDRPEMVKR